MRVLLRSLVVSSQSKVQFFYSLSLPSFSSVISDDELYILGDFVLSQTAELLCSDCVIEVKGCVDLQGAIVIQPSNVSKGRHETALFTNLASSCSADLSFAKVTVDNPNACHTAIQRRGSQLVVLFAIGEECVVKAAATDLHLALYPFSSVVLSGIVLQCLF
jgi:hypothetical protein